MSNAWKSYKALVRATNKSLTCIQPVCDLCMTSCWHVLMFYSSEVVPLSLGTSEIGTDKSLNCIQPVCNLCVTSC